MMYSSPGTLNSTLLQFLIKVSIPITENTLNTTVVLMQGIIKYKSN